MHDYLFFPHRSYAHPTPSFRLVVDFVSSFVCAVKKSLRCGPVCNRTFTLSVRTDVFKFLFNGKGSVVRGKRSLSYVLDDFDSDYFPSNWYVWYNKLGNGCKVDFPCFMHSYVKFAPTHYLLSDTDTPIAQPRTYEEIVTITLVKCCC